MKQTSWIKQSKRALLMGTALALGLMSPANAAIDNVQEVQTWLKQLGFEPGPADGSYGGRTKQALEAFYQGKGGSFDGELSDNEVQDLKEAIKVAGISEEGISPLTKSTIKFSLVNQSPQQRFTYPDDAEWHTIPQGLAVFDVDENGVNEVYFSFKAMPNFPDVPNVVFTKNNGKVDDVTQQVFGEDVPTSNAGTRIVFSDLNDDGKKDVVYSEAGDDLPPFARTSSIEILLNKEGKFKRITQSFEDKTTGIRSYATVVGNIDKEKYGEVLLSSGLDTEKSIVLEFDSDGFVKAKRNPFIDNPNQFWDYAKNATNFVVDDFDRDGNNDIYVGGNWNGPTNYVLWSGLRAKKPVYLTESVLGWVKWGEVERGSGGDVDSTVSADFDNDGDLDLISGIGRVYALKNKNGYDVDYDKGSILQVLEQVEPRKFKDKTSNTGNNLGVNYILPMIVYDLNSDGLLDIVVNYWMTSFWIEEKNWLSSNLYGSMFLINKGGMKFEQQLASDMPGYDQKMEGMIFPLSTENGKTSVMVLQPKSGGAAERYVDGYLADLTFE
jgi:peptidoglycan hydrolase-like protein with peptidoglycan-binding domain